MLRAVWNFLALLMFGATGLWGLVLARLNLWPALLLSLGILAALSWGFYRRRFARWRTVVGWAYTGLSLGILGGIAGQDRPFWLLAAWVVGIGILLLTLPGRFNGLFWTAGLLYLRPAGWSVAAAQSRKQVLAASPFTLHEVVRVTEQLEGGVVQQAVSVMDRLECRYQGDPVENSRALTDLEDWVLTRYRHYRYMRRLPVSQEITPRREVSREEDRPVELFGSSEWDSSGELGLLGALEGGPFEIWVRFLGSADSFRVGYRATPERHDLPATSDLQREFQTDFDRGFPSTFLTMADVERFGWITESVTLRLKRTNRSVHTYPDLASAEADVWARYRSQRRARNPERQNP